MGSRSVQSGSVTDLIRQMGARATPARVRVLEFLRVAHGPVTHSELEKAVSASGIDRVTLYRVLEWLCESGVASRNTDTNRVYRYALVDPGEHGEHVHFRCETCGGVFCLSESQPVLPTLPPGFALRHADFNLSGDCARCSETAGAPASARLMRSTEKP